MRSFAHSFPIQATGFSPFAVARDSKAVVEMDFDAEQGFWLSANREGFDFLARLFAELAHRDLWAGYHFHADRGFGEVELHGDGSVRSVRGMPRDDLSHMFTFELINPNFETEDYGPRPHE